MLSSSDGDKEIAFRKSVADSFVKTGCFPLDNHSKFVPYSSLKNADQGEISASHARSSYIDLTDETLLVQGVTDYIDDIFSDDDDDGLAE